jgi:AAA15 family ATPase/GTPase
MPYKVFTSNELENISNLPILKEKSNSEHFSNIIINNFRQFSEIELNDIGQFNLILGDNNVGKTSLLEALLFSIDSDLYFKNLIFSYASRVNTLEFRNPNDFILDIINKDAEKEEFSFLLQEDRQEFNFTIKIPNEDEVRSKYHSSEDIDVNKYLCIVSDGKICNMKTLSLILENITDMDLVQTQYIPYGKGFDKDLVKVYAENIDRNKAKRNSFLESMRVFIPNIDRITTDTDEGKVYIEEKDVDNDSSLHQYGEGAKKLFRILVQITLQKGKKLLIDEIDAGIHYSHFNEFWKVILKVAKENNVQIFATTHNMECIGYFKEVLEEEDMKDYQDLSRTLTLRELPNGRVKAYTRTFEEFEYELNQSLEIRGGNL